MPMFMLVHKWNAKDEMTVMKEVVGGYGAIQKTPDVKLHYSYALSNGAFCVWEAPSKEALEKLFEKYTPVLKKGTEFVPVVQSYPPTIEYDMMLAQMIIHTAK
jgi:hypothetical protein